MNYDFLRKCLYVVIAIIAVTLFFLWKNDKSNDDSDEDDKCVAEIKDSDESDDSSADVQTEDVTYYYELQYIVRGGKKLISDESQGQFVSFIDGACYESNIDGDDVGNGYLTFNKDKSSGREVYSGAAYWSDDCTFIFTDERRSLHVKIAGEERILVYHRTSPPQGRRNYSLLRSTDRQIVNILLGRPFEPEASTTHPKRDDGNGGHYVKVDCQACRGTGRVATTITVNNYGLKDELRRCPECGEMHYSDHAHKDCPICNGTGKVDRYVSN